MAFALEKVNEQEQLKSDGTTIVKGKQVMKPMEKKAQKRKRIVISIHCKEAGEVLLAGDFNHWNPKSHPMKNAGDGEWQKTLMLKPGTYEYKFVVDGRWQTDDQNPLICRNCFGTSNNFIHV